MSRFQLPSEQSAWIGAEAAFTNAKRHLDDAKTMAERKSFGVAAGLVVLATEEAVKSVMLCVYSLKLVRIFELSGSILGRCLQTKAPDGLTSQKYMEGILHNHKTRHFAAFGIFFGFWLMAQMRDEVTLREVLFRRVPYLVKNAKTNGLADVIDFLQDASNLKERGLYVDTDGATWSAPSDVTAIEYQKARKVADALILGLQNIQARWANAGFTRESFVQEFNAEWESDADRVTAELQEEMNSVITRKSFGDLTKQFAEGLPKHIVDRFDDVAFVPQDGSRSV